MTLFRAPARDAWVVAAAAAQASALVGLALWAGGAGTGGLVLLAAAVALGTVWGSNTVAHIHLHAPLFAHRSANRCFSLALSISLSIPQTWWRRRHLWHHAGEPAVHRPRPSWRALGRLELTLIAASWVAAASFAPRLFLLAYLPGWAAGLALCALQGHAEHAGGTAVNHLGRVYNRIWFNDGHHAQHHARPSAHWTSLPHLDAPPGTPTSPLPPLLRFLQPIVSAFGTLQAEALDRLERWSMRHPAVMAFMVDRHAHAIAALLCRPGTPSIEGACIVGGGLHPRTALALRRFRPGLPLVILDASAAHLAMAQRALIAAGENHDVTYVHERFTASALPRADLLVIPLAFRGERARLYREPPAKVVLVHDWIWVRRGEGRCVSPLLAKRLNLVVGAARAGREDGKLEGISPWRPTKLQPSRRTSRLRPRSTTPSSASAGASARGS